MIKRIKLFILLDVIHVQLREKKSGYQLVLYFVAVFFCGKKAQLKFYFFVAQFYCSFNKLMLCFHLEAWGFWYLGGCFLTCPSPGDLPDPGSKPGSPTLQADSLLSEPPEKPSGTSRLSSDALRRPFLSHVCSLTLIIFYVYINV